MRTAEAVYDRPLGRVGAPVVGVADAVAVFVGGSRPAEDPHQPHREHLVPVNVLDGVFDGAFQSGGEVVGEKESRSPTEAYGGGGLVPCRNEGLLKLQVVVPHLEEDERFPATPSGDHVADNPDVVGGHLRGVIGLENEA